MDLRNINFSDMTEKDWDDLERRAKEERNDIKHGDTVAALDLYNNIIRNIYSAFQYKTAVEMMKFEFINVYDISCLTGVSLKELKCIELFLGKSR